MTETTRQPVYLFEGFRLDARRRVLFAADGQPIALTPRLFDTLLYFVERAGELLPKDRLLEALWPNVIVEEHNLNKNISELRRVLGEKPGEHRFIVTKAGHGYRFVADVSLAQSRGIAGVPPRPDRDATESVHEPAVESDATVATREVQAGNARRYWVAAWCGAGAVAAAVVVLGFLGSSPEPPLRITPWSVNKGTQWFPVWSPDGTSTAFVTFGGVSNEPPELVIRDLDEPVGRPIARRPSPGGFAQWTTMGKLLFFEPDGLWSISPVGGQPERLVPLDYARLGVPAWLRMADVTKDGSTLAMFARDGDNSVGLWTATPPSAMLERYEPAPFEGAAFYGAPFLRFSPSGRQLLLIFYAAGRGLEAWLVPFPADGRNPPRRVFDGLQLVGDALEFSWFPDERHVVLAAAVGPMQEGLKRRLYVADTQSENFRVLTESFNNPGVPVVSPDGSKLIVSDALIDFDIVTLDLQTAAVTTTIATDLAELLPAWAADTNAMVYATDRSGAWEIWLHRDPEPDRPLVTARDFPTATGAVFAPTLSPDGTRAIFTRVDAEGAPRLWISAVAGGEPELLTNEELAERAGSWSPGGDWYVYWASPPDGGRRTLKKVRTTGRATPETVLEDLQLAATRPAPTWSPDGRWILVAHQGLTLVSLTGEPSRNLGSDAMPCAFADTEPLLYCIRGDLVAPLPVGEYAFLVLDFDGNVIRTNPLPPAYRPLSQLTPGIRLSLTPDGLGVTYSVASSSQTLWLVEGLDQVPLL